MIVELSSDDIYLILTRHLYKIINDTKATTRIFDIGILIAWISKWAYCLESQYCSDLTSHIREILDKFDFDIEIKEYLKYAMELLKRNGVIDE